MIKLAVLDIAGTTVEEHQAVYRALEDAVVAAGGRPTTADIAAWMGAGKREAITELLTRDGRGPTTALVETTFDDFRARLATAYEQDPPSPFPGVPQALERLRTAGIKVALTTGFDRTVTDNLLAVIGWDEQVLDAVICVDDVRAGRPAPYLIFHAMEATGVSDVRGVLIAGDTVRDLEAGTNAGAALVVGVTSGGNDAATLSAHPHSHILAGVAAIPDLLVSLGQPV